MVQQLLTVLMQMDIAFNRCIVMRCDAQSRSNGLEDGYEGVSGVTAQLMKRVACVVGPDILQLLLPKLTAMVERSASWQQQCTAAELLAGAKYLAAGGVLSVAAGLVRGSRHWGSSGNQVHTLLPLIEQALEVAPTVDTMSE